MFPICVFVSFCSKFVEKVRFLLKKGFSHNTWAQNSTMKVVSSVTKTTQKEFAEYLHYDLVLALILHLQKKKSFGCFFLYSEVAKHWNMCPEKWWNPHPWTSSKLEALSNMQLNLTSQLALWPTGTLELESWSLDQINYRKPTQSKSLCDLNANFRWNPSLTLGVFKFLRKDSSAKLFANSFFFLFFSCCYKICVY